MNDETTAALDEYLDTFGEPLPLMFLRGKDEDGIAQIAQSCVSEGTPYDCIVSPDIMI